MALTHSDKIATGSIAPNFNLLDSVTDRIMPLTELKGKKGTLILFICNHCPFVIHIIPTLKKLAAKYQALGINFIAISSNDINKYPADSPDKMKQLALKENYTFPYLYDETQAVAKSYGATCTPDIYLYDNQLALQYHGQLDDSRPGNNIKCTGIDLANAIENMLANKNTIHQKPSIGCGIKWK